MGSCPECCCPPGTADRAFALRMRKSLTFDHPGHRDRGRCPKDTSGHQYPVRQTAILSPLATAPSCPVTRSHNSTQPEHERYTLSGRCAKCCPCIHCLARRTFLYSTWASALQCDRCRKPGCERFAVAGFRHACPVSAR